MSRVRHAIDGVEEVLIAIDQLRGLLTVGKADKAGPCAAERLDEGRQLVPAAPVRRPIDLGPPPRRRNEPDDLGRRLFGIPFGVPAFDDRGGAFMPRQRNTLTSMASSPVIVRSPVLLGEPKQVGAFSTDELGHVYIGANSALYRIA